MKRATIVLGIIAILASSCGESSFPTQLAATLQDQVAQIRTFAEHGRPGFARSELRALVELVTSRLEAGRIDEAQAAEIIAAARAVADQLALVPRAAPSPSSSPVPEVDEGGGGNKGDKGDGHGDEGHGKDD